jgi:serine/threonine protein kinase
MSLDLRPGAVFAGDFSIVRPLSEGGMGSVYVVSQISTGAQRALKLMRRELVADASLRDRFLQEARVGSRIASDHVVQVIAAGIDAASNVPWLVMELLNGEEVADRVKRAGPMSRAEVTEVAKQLGHALAAAHAVGVVHRDLKPNNLFLAASRTAGAPFSLKVLDFGIAKIVADAKTTGTVGLGTPLWMAPEQTEAKGYVGPGTDVWAVGLIVFYLLTGKSFWMAAAQPSTGIQTLLREILFEPIVPPSRRAAELGCGHLLPQGFDAWFLRCVERDPQKRESSIQRALDDLVALLAQPAASSGPQLGSLPAGAARPTGTQIDQPLPFAQSSPSVPSVQSMPATSAAAPMPHVVSHVSTPQPQQQHHPQQQQQVWGPTHAPVTTQTGGAPPQRRSMLGLFAALGGLLVIGGGIGGYLVWGGDDRKKTSDKKRRSSDDDDDDGPRKKKKSSSNDSDKDADCQTMAELATMVDSDIDALDDREYPSETAQFQALIAVVEAGSKRFKDHEWKSQEGRTVSTRLTGLMDDIVKSLRKALNAASTGDSVTSTAELEKVQKLTEEADKLEIEFKEACGMAGGM